MKPADRYDWLVSYLEVQASQFGVRSHARVDVLNRHFVDDYCDATGAACYVMPFGANKCPQLGRDLAALAKSGRLVRHAVGLEGMSGMGFPRWVWSYQLPPLKGQET